MNFFRSSLALALALVVALGLCFTGCLLTERGMGDLATRWRSLRNRDALRVRARRDLLDLARKYGDLPLEKWTPTDWARHAAALTVLRDLGEQP
jgi:hypothetical protein